MEARPTGRVCRRMVFRRFPPHFVTGQMVPIPQQRESTLLEALDCIGSAITHQIVRGVSDDRARGIAKDIQPDGQARLM